MEKININELASSKYSFGFRLFINFLPDILIITAMYFRAITNNEEPYIEHYVTIALIVIFLFQIYFQKYYYYILSLELQNDDIVIGYFKYFSTYTLKINRKNFAIEMGIMPLSTKFRKIEIIDKEKKIKIKQNEHTLIENLLNLTPWSEEFIEDIYQQLESWQNNTLVQEEQKT